MCVYVCVCVCVCTCLCMCDVHICACVSHIRTCHTYGQCSTYRGLITVIHKYSMTTTLAFSRNSLMKIPLNQSIYCNNKLTTYVH